MSKPIGNVIFSLLSLSIIALLSGCVTATVQEVREHSRLRNCRRLGQTQ